MTKEFDLSGLVPESWCCVDCGVNTAPGLSNRAEMEAWFNAGHQSIEQTYDNRSEVYFVRAVIWQRAGMEPFGGCLCIECLEKRLGRQLKPKDFERGHELNMVPGTPRLRQRQKARMRP